MNRMAIVAVIVVAALAAGAILWAFLGGEAPSSSSPPSPAPHGESPAPEPAPDDPSTHERAPDEPAPVGLEADVRRGGKPVAGDVRLWVATATDRASFSDGPFEDRRLPEQPAGRYVIVASAGGDVGLSKPFTYAEGEARRVRIDLRPGANVTGRVIASSRGQADAMVNATTGRFDVVEASGATGPLAEELTNVVAGLTTEATSEAGGRFELRGCPTGQVTLVADGEAGHGEARVAVKAPRTSDVVIELRTDSTLHGTARFWDGVPIAGGAFELRSESGEAVSFGTDAAGAYRIESLKPGQYRVAHVQDSGTYVVPAVTIDVGPGENVEFDFSAGIVTVDGLVKRGEKPAGGVQVVFFDEDESLTTLTDVDGRYTLEVHRAGEYQVQLEGREPFRTLVANDHRCTLDFVIP
jgi:hypothetical protein